MPYVGWEGLARGLEGLALGDTVTIKYTEHGKRRRKGRDGIYVGAK